MLTPITLYPHRHGFVPRRPVSGDPPPPTDGHAVRAVVLMEGGPVRWEFDGPIASTGEACRGLLVAGHNPSGVMFTPGDDFVTCLYSITPAPGTPWLFTGPASELTFEDARPGLPSSGTLVPE